MQVEIEHSHFRRLVREVSGKDISSSQVEAFMDIFRTSFEAALTVATRTYIAQHFGTKAPSTGKA